MEKEHNYKEPKEQNVYASKVDGSIIHISQAESGRNGYFCLGCEGIMQAKKGDILVHHFSHEPKDITRIGKCTYSDETYRHKIAKEILQMNKEIKVPAVYKYPPKNIEGGAYKIKDSETIKASKVGIELYFYEDIDGTIKHSNHETWKEDNQKFLIIKPDVTFFDSENKPILFIEIVATHKADEDKKSKIRKLGINTVQVTIPKDSKEEIEKTFNKTERTKWLYNYEEAKSEYIRIPIGDSTGVPQIDELQRELFEESTKCRTSQINNFIRAIAKSLGNEQYRKVIRNLGEELQRVKENTDRTRERLEGVQEELRSGIDRKYESERSRIRTIRTGIEEEYRTRRAKIDQRYTNLEGRYRRKKQEIIDEETRIGESRKTIESKDKFENDRIEIERAELGLPRKSFEERIGGIRNRREEVDGTIRELQERRDNLPAEFRIREEELGSQFEINRRRTVEETENRNVSELSKSRLRIKRVLDSGIVLNTLTEAIVSYKRYRKAKELLDNKSWKNWT